MPIDPKLLDILCCPSTHVPLRMLEAGRLAKVNAAIAAGGVKKIDGGDVTEPLDEALITQDGKRLYPIRDGIPHLLVEEGIATLQIADF